MIKFIDNINNLLCELLSKDKLLLIFYKNNDINSLQLIDKINMYDIDLIGNIVLVDYDKFLNENYNKLNVSFIKNYLKYYIKYHDTPNLENQLSNLLFLTKENITDIKLPQIYFLKKEDDCLMSKYKSQYLDNHIDNNIINLIKGFFSNYQYKKIKKNNIYVDEFNENGEIDANLNEDDIKNKIVYI